ncbi:MAG: hypothetical protein JXQ90_12705 [Cyclobacteriaceae bacterium]
MDKQAYKDFLVIWDQVVWILFFVAVAAAVIVFLSYLIRYHTKKDLKAKFDLASEKEIKAMQMAQYVLALSFFFVANQARTETVQLSPVWFGIRVFIGASIATLHAYIAFLIFKYYYPGPLSKRLERLRYTPRVNPLTGNKMKLLSEAEEDAYLDEGMQAEEDVFSVDYDVWIDTETGATKIEKYQGHLTALQCDRCGFQTLRLKKEEITREATEWRDGELHQEFNCSYCGRIKRKTIKITKKINQDFRTGKLIDDPLSHDRRIETIKLEIHSNKGEIKNFDFQNIQQAKQFLEEFDFEKLDD